MDKKNIVFLHGRASNSFRGINGYLIHSLEEELLKRGLTKGNLYSILHPELPKPRFPSFKKWLTCLEDNLVLDSSNIVVAHSLSSQIAMHYLASCRRDDTKVSLDSLFLIAPFQTINYDSVNLRTRNHISDHKLRHFFATACPTFYSWLENSLVKKSLRNSRKWCSKSLPFEELKQYQDRIHMYFSDNDYYVDKTQQDLFQQSLPDSSLQIVKHAGHFSTDNMDVYSSIKDDFFNVIFD